MSRRASVAVAVLCVTVVLAGCNIGVTGPEPTESTASAEQTEQTKQTEQAEQTKQTEQAEQTKQTQPGERRTQTTLQPLPEPANHPGLTANLQIVVSTADRVRITVTERSDRGTVYDETFTERGYVRFGDGRVIRENGAYDVVIQVNGTVQWDRTVKHYESYDLRVVQNGSVVVESHSIA